MHNFSTKTFKPNKPRTFNVAIVYIVSATCWKKYFYLIRYFGNRAYSSWVSQLKNCICCCNISKNCLLCTLFYYLALLITLLFTAFISLQNCLTLWCCQLSKTLRDLKKMYAIQHIRTISLELLCKQININPKLVYMQIIST